jgi:sensor domain CHASE-containing protein
MLMVILLSLVLFVFFLYFINLFYQLNNVEKALDETVEMVEVMLLCEFGEATDEDEEKE